MSKKLRYSLIVVATLMSLSVAVAEGTTWRDVEPIFKTRCVMCHSGSNPPLGLRLDSLDDLLKGSKNGPVVIAGKPDNSELIRRLEGGSQPRMPLTGPPFLNDQEITMIKNWIMTGMKTGVSLTTESSPVAAASPAQKEILNFTDVMQILGRRCVKCHTERGLMGKAPEGYQLTSYDAATSSVDRVRIVPYYPETSELIRRIKGQSLPRMPFDGPPYLEESETTLMSSWVKQGARNSESAPAIYPINARVRVQGRLMGLWQLEDGLNLIVNSSTRIDKSPGQDDFVEVRGRIDKDGSIRVERIKRR